MNRGRLIILRASFEKHLRRRMEKASPSAVKRGPEFEQESQDLQDILDFLVDLENDRAFWESNASR